MKVLWKSDMGQGKHDPLEVTHVITKSGSQISADLVVPLEPHKGPQFSEYRDDGQYVPVKWYQDQKVEKEGLLEVIDAQMAAIDELTQRLDAVDPEIDTQAPAFVEKEYLDLKEWADQFPDMIEDLCMALGFARNPIAPTGIPELDRIVGLAR